MKRFLPMTSILVSFASASLAASFGMPGDCREGFATYLKNGRWIPALYNGNFVESVWANPRINASVPYKRQQ